MGRQQYEQFCLRFSPDNPQYICDWTSCNYCTGTYVYHGLRDEVDFEVQFVCTD